MATKMCTDSPAGRVEKPAVDAGRVDRKICWGLLPWMFTSGIITYLDRSNLSYAAPDLKRDLGLSNAQYGLGAGILFAGYAAMAIPSNIVISYMGARRWLPIITLLWGCVAACNAAATNAATFCALRFLLGAAEAGNFPGCWYHCTLFLSGPSLSFAYAVILSSAVLSQVIGAPIAAALLLMEGAGGLHGWQWLFILEGAVTVVYAAILAMNLAASPQTAAFLNQEERQWVHDRQTQALVAKEAEAARSSNAWAPLASVRMWWLSAAWFFVSASVTNILVWTPLLLEAALAGTFDGRIVAVQRAPLTLREQAWHTSKLALLSGILYVPTAAAMLGIGWSSMRRGERRWHCAIPLALSGVAFMCVPRAMARGAVAGFPVLILAAMTTWGVYGPMCSWPNTFLQGRAAAVGLAMFNVIGSIGGFVSPFIVGKLSNNGDYTNGMFLLGAFNLAAALMVLAYRELKGPGSRSPAGDSRAGSHLEDPQN